MGLMRDGVEMRMVCGRGDRLMDRVLVVRVGMAVVPRKRTGEGRFEADVEVVVFEILLS